jgi:hypothetical protein
MESIVYRKITDSEWTSESHIDSNAAYDSVASGPETAQDTQPLSPGLFYPLVTESEMVTWTHWLPTAIAFEQSPLGSASQVLSTLTRLNAPPAVLEEFHWTWKMGLFETYEVRTPVRRDLRDPLLLGKVGGQHYRIALWGESLRPLQEITTLVQQSLALRARAFRRRMWLTSGVGLLGFAFGVWLGTLPSYQGDPLGSGLVFALLGLFFAAILWFVRTPENCQQDFLDRYRC